MILHILNISGRRMKASGIDGLLRGDLLEGMMSGKAPLKFIPWGKGADERSGGKVSEWVRSWWTTKKGDNWGGFPLVSVTADNLFELHKEGGARLWMLPPAAMEVALEVFNEERISHPHIPHVFVVPRLMTHLWRKDLKKDADIQLGVPFWESHQFEPLLVVLVFPFSHVDRYSGPWVVKGTDDGRAAECALELGFKIRSDFDASRLHDVDGRVRRLWQDSQGWSRIVLQQLLVRTGTLPPVQKCLARELLPRSGGRSLPAFGGEPPAKATIWIWNSQTLRRGTGAGAMGIT